MGIKKRVTKAILIRAGAFALVMVLVGAVLIRSDVANKAYAAAPGDVIINELMYNPNTGNQLDEFLELYNTTGSSIDLSSSTFYNSNAKQIVSVKSNILTTASFTTVDKTINNDVINAVAKLF